MSEDLQDELTSINSIYGDDTLASLSESSSIYSLSLPAQPALSLRVEFPKDYPDAPPSILGTQHVGEEIAKGEGTTIVELVRTILAEIYSPGAPCIFDLVEESGQRLQQLGLDRSSKNQEQQASQTNGQDAHHHDYSETYSDERQPLEELGDPPPWTLSEIITEKKSVFIARAAPVSSVEQAKTYLAHLLATDKKVAKATHNITAWRIRGDNGVQFQDCDDDGEDAAGGRLLHLLELMNVWGTMVVVSRWYGGVKLGPDRFRIINQCARDAIVRDGFAPSEDAKDVGKKKGKK
ncbi:impact family [Lecanosticta acicola]|uniref:Impact family n=1 Tax=Lecanosticta acicola TaxID=111012 RepID=A0AAI8YSS3_9PEZI|nr:impact family [Lecanosticta acicola]